MDSLVHRARAWGIALFVAGAWQNAGFAEWDVRFLSGGDNPSSSGDPWRFQATNQETGVQRTFRSGTRLGRFKNVRSYGTLAAIEAETGYGPGFTIYDLEADRLLVEFYTLTSHWSPDGRYLAYQVFASRNEPFRPEIKIVDLQQNLAGLPVDQGTSRDGIGTIVYPPLSTREQLASGHGRDFPAYSFRHVAWDVANGFLYFTASDMTGMLNVIVLQLATTSIICYVPITLNVVDGEFLHPRRVLVRGLSLRSSREVVVTTSNAFGVASRHTIPLRRACSHPDQDSADSLDRSHGSVP